jgi:hypothetical protein
MVSAKKICVERFDEEKTKKKESFKEIYNSHFVFYFTLLLAI